MTASAKEAGATVVRPVPWDDAAAVALREAMEEEMGARYADLLASAPDYLPKGMNVEPETVVYTGIAYTGRACRSGTSRCAGSTATWSSNGCSWPRPTGARMRHARCWRRPRTRLARSARHGSSCRPDIASRTG